MSMHPENDIAGHDYWETSWKTTQLPRTVHPYKNPIERRWCGFYRKHLSRLGRFLELGCAASAWMPFFGQEFGYELWGVDYSETGLELTRKNLEMLGLSSHLVLGDFLQADLPRQTFKVIFSRGVIEHFQDPSPMFRRAVDLLEPGGLKVTVIPNMTGLYGILQKRLNRAVYDVHMPFTAADLDRFQTESGLEPLIAARPFGVFYLGLMNWDEVYHKIPGVLRRPMAYLLQTLDRVIGLLTQGAEHVMDNAWTSPYFVSIYRKPR